MRRYKIKIEYDGIPFVGWQKQENELSVQGCLEQAVKNIFEEDVTIFGAGRTDAGVHAMGQVAHFDIINKHLDTHVIKNAINDHLRPHPISILNVVEVDHSFHARFNAVQRKYLYRVINRKSPLTIEKGRAWHVYKDLNIKKMKKCSVLLEGKHDFTTFRSANCQSNSPIKTLDEVKISKSGENIYFGFVAKSYLHHQIRSLVGSIKLVGDETWTSDDLENALKAKDRTMCGALAPPDGLYFMEAKY